MFMRDCIIHKFIPLSLHLSWCWHHAWTSKSINCLEKYSRGFSSLLGNLMPFCWFICPLSVQSGFGMTEAAHNAADGISVRGVTGSLGTVSFKRFNNSLLFLSQRWNIQEAIDFVSWECKGVLRNCYNGLCLHLSFVRVISLEDRDDLMQSWFCCVSLKSWEHPKRCNVILLEDVDDLDWSKGRSVFTGHWCYDSNKENNNIFSADLSSVWVNVHVSRS